MKTKNKNKKNENLQYFVISKPFKVIFNDFFAKFFEEFNFLRGEPYFSKTNKYLYSR